MEAPPAWLRDPFAARRLGPKGRGICKGNTRGVSFVINWRLIRQYCHELQDPPPPSRGTGARRHRKCLCRVSAQSGRAPSPLLSGLLSVGGILLSRTGLRPDRLL